MRYSLMYNGVYCALTIYFICGQIQSLGVPKIGGFQFIQNHPKDWSFFLMGKPMLKRGVDLYPTKKCGNLIRETMKSCVSIINVGSPPQTMPNHQPTSQDRNWGCIRRFCTSRATHRGMIPKICNVL